MKYLFLLLIASVAFASPVFAPIQNGFAGPSTDPTVIELSIISQEDADKLFHTFSQHSEIPFRYPIDGCYARATAMTEIAESRGVIMGRIYAEGSLQVATKLQKYPRVRWGWHVAPVAYVRRATGKAEVMVFDPSLFSRPVTPQEWTAKMSYDTPDYHPRLRRIYYGSRFQYFNHDRSRSKPLQGVHALAENTMRVYSNFQSGYSAASKPLATPPTEARDAR